MRRGNILAKNPISGSNSVRVRPDTGEPTMMSLWLLSRYNSDWKAASISTNGVTL